MKKQTAVFLAATFVLSCSMVGAEDEPAMPVSGNAERGKAFYAGYKCFACHGWSGQTGIRRLVPMRWPEEPFVTFVQNSPLADMPAYKDVPRAHLLDLYAYLRSVPVDAPAVESIPLLKNIEKAAQPRSE